MEKTLKLILIALFLSMPIIAEDKISVAIYDDEGCWADGITAFEKFLDWKGASYHRLNGKDIRFGKLNNIDYDIIYIPGGMANFYYKRMQDGGVNSLREFVKNGGGYIGICAGAYFAADSIIWENGKYNYNLDLFDGIAYGSIKEIIPWDNYTLTNITLNLDNQLSKFQKKQYTTLYYGGPAFLPHNNSNINILATWDSFQNKPAIINFKYGEGRVFLTGPHLEIEENSLRDGQDFASDMTDPESEWDILWVAIDWLANKGISQPPNRIDEQTDFQIKCYPNPVENIVNFDITSKKLANIEIKIYDKNGKLCDKYISQSIKIANQKISINCTDFVSGTYFYTIKIMDKTIYGKFIYSKTNP